MKKLLICCLLITNIILGQNTNDANILLQSIYAQLINNDGSLINFEYLLSFIKHLSIWAANLDSENVIRSDGEKNNWFFFSCINLKLVSFS